MAGCSAIFGAVPLSLHDAQDAGDSQVHAAPQTVQSRDTYLKRASTEHLERFAERSWALYTRLPYERVPVQPAPDIVEAYRQARRLAPVFEALVIGLARELSVDHRMRPGGVKDANRALEKMGSRQGAVPLDLLGGTLICPTVDGMYRVVERLCARPAPELKLLEVVAFRDRCLAPVPTGYRDLQLTVRLEDGHLAELKVLHGIIADLDRHEHRLFEIQRSLEAENPTELSFVDGLVSNVLAGASRRMYHQAWTRVLELEPPQPPEGDKRR